MSYYSSKAAVSSAIASTDADIRAAQEKHACLAAAYDKVDDVITSVATLSSDFSQLRSSLNTFTGSFTWEGSQVHKVQDLFQESIDAIMSYEAANRLRLTDIYVEMMDTNSRIAGLNAQKRSLTTQYNNWDAAHPST